MRDEAHKHTSDGAARAHPPARLWLWVALSALSGLLVYLSFAPADLGPLAFVAFAPLLVAVGRARFYGGAALCGAAAGAAACLPAFAWVRSVALPGWLGLGVYVGTYFVVAALAFRYVQRSFGALWPLPAAVTWVGLEVCRAHLGPGFPWLFIGYTQYRFLPLIQAAAVGGVYAVSFMVLLVNAALAGLFVARSRLAGRVAVLVLALLVSGGAALAGRAAIAGLPLREGPVVGVVQQNIPRLVPEIFAEKSMDRIHAEMEAEVGKASELSRTLAGRSVRLLVWPESTVQFALNISPQLFVNKSDQDLAVHTLAQLTSLGRLLDAYLLIGAPTYLARSSGYVEKPLYGVAVTGFGNSAVFMSPAGEFIDRYDKIRLVPFGEYIPQRKLLPFLQFFTPISREVTPGTDEVIFGLPPDAGSPPVHFAALICYEDVFAGLTRDFRLKGADFMVNLTDEGWYVIPGELGQHLAMAVFRAVETRTTVVRAANTGVSCFIDPRGRVYAGLEPLTAGARSAPVQLCPVLTPYVRWGDVFGITCLMLAIALPPLRAAASRREAAQPPPQ